MPYGGGDGIDISIPASTDLSSHQYKFMTIDANGRGTIATACDDVLVGVLQNKPGTTDVPARVRVYGISKLKYGAATNEAALLASGPEGFGTATTSDTDTYGAICMRAVGASADVGMALVVGPHMVAA